MLAVKEFYRKLSLERSNCYMDCLFVKSNNIGIVPDDVSNMKFSGKALLKYRMG